MKIRSVTLDIVCGVTSKLPATGRAEIAFAGKSNVGKSSLLNALIRRKALARTSARPGKTQTINFYLVNEAFYLVDLPGYGYANVPVKERKAWGAMIERYLHSSKDLRAVFLLLDIRHAPTENDRQMYAWMVGAGFTPVIIATKLDKIKRSQVQKQIRLLRETLALPKETAIIPFSAQTKDGREELYAAIREILGKDVAS